MIHPFKPFAFMVVSALMGLLPLAVLFFILWILALLNNVSKG